MKITMYELLGMVKDDKAPEKIKYDNMIWEYDGDYYFTRDNLILEEYTSLTTSLNDEVEILEEEPYVEVCGSWFTKSEYDKLFLEEEKKIPEKIKIDEKSITVKGTTFFREKDIEIFQKLSMEINEIIDYLKSKGE